MTKRKVENIKARHVTSILQQQACRWAETLFERLTANVKDGAGEKGINRAQRKRKWDIQKTVSKGSDGGGENERDRKSQGERAREPDKKQKMRGGNLRRTGRERAKTSSTRVHISSPPGRRKQTGREERDNKEKMDCCISKHPGAPERRGKRERERRRRERENSIFLRLVFRPRSYRDEAQQKLICKLLPSTSSSESSADV